jgi:translation initiation factor IF-1
VSDARLFGATVLESLPNARYRCRSQDGREWLCHVAGDMRLKVVRILPGDEVSVEPSPYDAGKGRILGRVEGKRRQEA